MVNQQACKHCGTNNPLHHTFCFQCGAELAAQASSDAVVPTGLLQSQHLLKQRYLIRRMVGKGGMGAVYEAEDLSLGNRRVAVKEMSQSSLSAHEQVEAANNFKREAHLLAGLQPQQHLPSIHEHFFEAGRWYLVMSFIVGETLAAYARKVHQGILPVEEVLAMGMQLTAVLEYLHTQQPPIIFRDLKPANIMRTTDGHLYLIDFGIARHFKTGQAKDTHVFISLGYAAPEQYGKAQTTARSDIYSLGATLHQCLSGSNPADTPFRFAPLPSQSSQATALAALIMQMVEMDERNRPNNMAQVKQQLQHIAGMADILLPGRGIPPTVKASGFASAAPPTVRIPSPVMILPSGTLLCTLRLSSFPPQSERAASWLADGSRLATVSSDGTIQHWDANTGKSLRNATLPMSTLESVAWSPDGNRVAFISSEERKAIQVWDVLNGQIVTKYQSPTWFEQNSTKIAWSSNSKWIASTLKKWPGSRLVLIWDASTGQEITRQQVANFGDTSFEDPHRICKIVWSPDCAHLVCAFPKTNDIRLLDFVGNMQKFDWGYWEDLAWSPDGVQVAILEPPSVYPSEYAKKPCSIHIWNTTSNAKTTFILRGEEGSLIGKGNILRWSPDGSRIAMKVTVKNEETIHICDARTGILLFTSDVPYPTDSIASIIWSPDGTRIAVQLHNRVQIWQVA